MTACPAGWRLSDTSDFRDLVTVAGCVDEHCRNVGKKLRAETGWVDRYGEPIDYGTDDFGFSALPGGTRHQDARFGFEFIGYHTAWWLSPRLERYHRVGYIWHISDNTNEVLRNWDMKEAGNYVRCVRQ
jgi:uncharacterized protein (TIGR02145 family)